MNAILSSLNICYHKLAFVIFLWDGYHKYAFRFLLCRKCCSHAKCYIGTCECQSGICHNSSFSLLPFF